MNPSELQYQTEDSSNSNSAGDYIKPWELGWGVNIAPTQDVDSIKPWELGWGVNIAPKGKEEGFFDAIGEDIGNRREQFKKDLINFAGGDTPQEFALNLATNTGGGLANIAMEGVEYLTPDVVKDALTAAGQYIADTDIGKGALSLLGEGAQLAGQGYEYLEENAPRVARQIKGAGDAAMFMGASPLTRPVARYTGNKVVNTTKKAANLASGAVNLTTELASKAISNIGDHLVKNKAVLTGEILDNIQEMPKSLRLVYDKLKSDLGEENVQAALMSYIKDRDVALINKGGNELVGLAEGAAVYPKGAAASQKYFDKAIPDAAGKVSTSISKNISNSANFYDDLDEVLISGRIKAKPLYDKAYVNNSSIGSDVIDDILQTPAGKDALKGALKDIGNDVNIPNQERLKIAEDINNYISSGKGKTSLRALDYVKRHLDDKYSTAVRAGDSSDIRTFKNQASKLREELFNLDKDGSYKKALSTSGDYLTTKGAMENGLTFINKDVDLLKREIKSYTPTQMDAFKAGVVNSLNKRMGNMRSNRDVTQVFADIPNMQKKLSMVLNPKEYANLMDDVNAAKKVYENRNRIMSNSRTAFRQNAAGEFVPDMGDVASTISGTGFQTALMNLGRAGLRKFTSKLGDKTAKEVADILYEIDPAKKKEIVDRLLNEVNKSSSSLRKTEAAQKLKVIYDVSDFLKNKKLGKL